MNEDKLSPASNEENIFAPTNTPAPVETPSTPVAEPTIETVAEEPAAETANGAAEPTVESAATPETSAEPAAEPTAESPATPEEPTTTEAPAAPIEPATEEPSTAPVSPFATPSVPDAQTNTPAQTSVAQPVKKKSKAPLILGIIFLLLLIGGGVFYFVAQKLISDAKPQEVEPVADVEEEPEVDEEDKVSSLRLSDEKLSDFDFALLKTAEADKNVIYSPLSIKYALTMLSEGADGDTKTQIENVLGDYKAKAYINSENRALANALFVRDSFKGNVLEDYITTLKDNYAADVVEDSFANAGNINKWISDQTLGIITDAVDDGLVSNLDFVLTNALAIDMEWENALQCAAGSKANRIFYVAKYDHETYDHKVDCISGDTGFDQESFNEKKTRVAKIGASINNYDLVTELGEDKVKETIEEAYEKWLKESYKEGVSNKDHLESINEYSPAEAISKKYIEELKANYQSAQFSTDFMMEDTDDVLAFAKDLKEYDGATLQYVAVMPKSQELGEFIKGLKAEDFAKIIEGLKELKGEDFEDGFITQIDGYVPFFKYNYDKDLVDDFKKMKITDVFDSEKANLSKMFSVESASIDVIEHKADIDFSNDGIKAAAVTVGGGLGDSSGDVFRYNFEIPEEKIKKIELNFDKPFIYVIRDKNTGEVWFTGATYEGKTE